MRRRDAPPGVIKLGLCRVKISHTRAAGGRGCDVRGQAVGNVKPGHRVFDYDFIVHAAGVVEREKQVGFDDIGQKQRCGRQVPGGGISRLEGRQAEYRGCHEYRQSLGNQVGFHSTYPK